LVRHSPGSAIRFADLPSPAAETWLDHDRQLGDGGRERRRDESRMRVRQPGEQEDPGGQQLVVRRHHCSRRIEHLDSFRCEPLQVAGAALDAVEALEDVQPGVGVDAVTRW
jgi:hypothetical protein